VGPSPISDQPDNIRQITYPYQHLEKDSPQNREARNTMEVTVHRVTDIRLERKDYDTFNTVTVTVTDRHGDETEFKLFSYEDHQIKIGEDK
jgi:hypothetical protein